jgi:choline kinase
MYKVLITTSGTGSRLKELTKNTNKALIKINGKAVISRIIESYPENIELVITVGYFGTSVKDFIYQLYPTRKITFVDIDNFDGEGSSLGYSMLQAADRLQCPFIFHCNDTLVEGTIPSPENYNWNGGSKGIDSSVYNEKSYSSFLAKDGKMTQMQAKGITPFDYFHIGLVGFKDFTSFWKNLKVAYQRNPLDSTLNDCVAAEIVSVVNC